MPITENNLKLAHEICKTRLHDEGAGYFSCGLNNGHSEHCMLGTCMGVAGAMLEPELVTLSK